MFFLISHYITSALQSIWSNKLRSFLSTLGIVIGIMSVTVFLSIGKGAEAEMNKYMDKYAEKKLTITARGGGGAYGQAENTEEESGKRQQKKEIVLTLDDVDFIKKYAHNIKNIYPNKTTNANVEYKNKKESVSIKSVMLDFFGQEETPTISLGRDFIQTDFDKKKPVIIINHALAKKIFDGSKNIWDVPFKEHEQWKKDYKILKSNPIGQEVFIKNTAFRVIGVLKPSENEMYDGGKTFMPIKTFQKYMVGDNKLSSIEIMITKTGNIDMLETELWYLFLRKYSLNNRDLIGLSINNQSKFQKEREEMTQKMSLILMGIGGISLLVGGIGVMNIMLVSVTERTREIGIRKAIGAMKYHIIGQFLTESIFISLLGGILAISGSYGIVKLLSSFEVPILMTFDVVNLACLFSFGVGVLFGFLPARKAANLKPIDALRFE